MQLLWVINGSIKNWIFMIERKEDTQAYILFCDIREALCRSAVNAEKSAKYIFNLNFKNNQLHDFDLNYFLSAIVNLLETDTSRAVNEYSVGAKVISDHTVQIELNLKVIKKVHLNFEISENVTN